MNVTPHLFVRAVLLHAGLDIVREATGRDLVTGHNAGTAFERPDWDRIFRQLSAEHCKWFPSRCVAALTPVSYRCWRPTHAHTFWHSW